jgi:methylmalonyl-CoA/ethylmalonyl-CoA epimerase
LLQEGRSGGENVTTAFFKTGDTKIELLEATDGHGVLKKFIDKRGEGLHHIAFEVEDIEGEMARLKGRVHPAQRTPEAGRRQQADLLSAPKDTAGVLVELCQEKESPGRSRG